MISQNHLPASERKKCLVPFLSKNEGDPLFYVRNSQALKLRPASPSSSLCSSKPGQA
jgi:hypothetical protein